MAIDDDMISDPKNLGQNLYCYYCCMTCINGWEGVDFSNYAIFEFE